MKKKLLSLTLASALLLANGLVGMQEYYLPNGINGPVAPVPTDTPTPAKIDEVVARETANLWNSLQGDPYPLHTIAANAESCMYPVSDGTKTIWVPVEEIITTLLEQGKNINELMQPDPNDNFKQTPLDIACELENKALANFLKKHGAQNTTIILCGQPDGSEEQSNQSLEVPLYLARKCYYFNNILNFREGIEQGFVLGEVRFEKLSHTKLVKFFNFLQLLENDVEEIWSEIQWLNKLNDIQNLAEVADYLQINKQKSAQAINQLPLQREADSTLLSILKLRSYNTFFPDAVAALINFLKYLGGKQAKLIEIHRGGFAAVLNELNNLEDANDKRIIICMQSEMGNNPEEAITKLADNYFIHSCHMPSSRNLSSEDIERICRLTKLRVIDLEDNFLTSLPAEIGNLTNLEQLNLKNNNISSLDDIKQICNLLPKLKKLNLNQNNLMELPPEIINTMPSLQKLKLRRNPLSLNALAIVEQLRNRGVTVLT